MVLTVVVAATTTDPSASSALFWRMARDEVSLCDRLLGRTGMLRDILLGRGMDVLLKEKRKLRKKMIEIKEKQRLD